MDVAGGSGEVHEPMNKMPKTVGNSSKRFIVGLSFACCTDGDSPRLKMLLSLVHPISFSHGIPEV